MGEGTFVNQAQPVKPLTVQRTLRLRLDVPMLLIVTTLIVFGLVMVFSASTDFSYMVLDEAPTYMFVHQVLYIGIGLIVAAVLSLIDYHFYRRLVVPMLLITLAALLAVIVFRAPNNTTIRTLVGGSVQPSELAKLVIIIYLSFWLYSKREVINNISFGLIPLGVILGITGGLIWKQPDLSATATIFILGGILFFLAGGAWRQIMMLFILGVFVGWAMVTFSTTGKDRWISWIGGLQDMTKSTDQVMRTLESIIKGGWFGVGIGLGDVKGTGLPLAPSDSIFSVVAEETGLVGSAFVVGLFSLFLWRGLKIARFAPDQLGSLLGAGLTIWIVLEAMINMMVIAGLFPVSGNALPFISYGGSNMVVTLSAVGIIMNIARQSTEIESTEGRSFSAVVDLRRWDRRRRVSRPRRPAGPGQ
jgi:cell division protein FtsW